MADDENAHDGNSSEQGAASRAAASTPQHAREGWEWERDLEAQGHGGVWRRSRMEKVCIHGRSDEQVRGKVKETLARCRLDASAVEIEVCDGVVRLSGVVASVEEKTAMEEICGRVHGARGVSSTLTVASPTHAR